MEKTIKIPDGVDVAISGRAVRVSGEKGSVERSFDDPRFNELVAMAREDGAVVVRSGDSRKEKAMCGTIAAHIGNMVRGVTKGFRYELSIIYTHFPVTVSVRERTVEIKNFLGEKGVRKARIIGDAAVEAGKDSIVITGASADDVGNTASNIEHACRLTKRDRRIFQDGIYISSRGAGE